MNCLHIFTGILCKFNTFNTNLKHTIQTYDVNIWGMWAGSTEKPPLSRRSRNVFVDTSRKWHRPVRHPQAPRTINCEGFIAASQSLEVGSAPHPQAMQPCNYDLKYYFFLKHFSASSASVMSSRCQCFFINFLFVCVFILSLFCVDLCRGNSSGSTSMSLDTLSGPILKLVSCKWKFFLIEIAFLAI